MAATIIVFFFIRRKTVSSGRRTINNSVPGGPAERSGGEFRVFRVELLESRERGEYWCLRYGENRERWGVRKGFWRRRKAPRIELGWGGANVDINKREVGRRAESFWTTRVLGDGEASRGGGSGRIGMRKGENRRGVGVKAIKKIELIECVF